MKILTDKVYYNGKEFIVNQWPKVKPGKDLDPDIYSLGYIEDCKRDYDTALTRDIEEGYVVKDVDNKILLLWMNDRGIDPISESDSRRILREGFLTLPEPREFDCIDRNVDGLSPRIAVLLPKEEIKPAPLGEEKKVLILDDDNDLILKIKELASHKIVTIGESSEELKRRHDRIFEIANHLWDKWALELENGGRRMTKDLFTLAIQDKLLKDIHSPTSEPPEDKTEWYRKLERKLQRIQSGELTIDHYIAEVQSKISKAEPPEEQEELWREVQNYLSKWVIDINDLKKNFTLHRKRD